MVGPLSRGLIGGDLMICPEDHKWLRVTGWAEIELDEVLEEFLRYTPLKDKP